MNDAGPRRPIGQHIDERAILQVLLYHHLRQLADADTAQGGKPLPWVIGFIGQRWSSSRMVWNRTSAPRAHSSGAVYSASLCDSPFLEGTKIIAVGMIVAICAASCPAPETTSVAE
ncbi:hypothetical protein D9M70_638250 [compost metagenome]